MPDFSAIAEAEIVEEKSYDSSDEIQVNEARKRGGRRKRKSLDFTSAILELPQGREWLYQLLTACECYRNSYVSNESPRDAAFREGKKFIGFQLQADARKADPNKYDLMIRECEAKKMSPLFPTSGLSDN